MMILLLALLDPFGLTSSTETASAQWLNRIFASNYSPSGQQQIVVVLIDDAYLLRNKTYWPMPYSEQSKLFKRLLAYQPAALFIDLLYSHDHSRGDPRQGSQLLANVFSRYQHQSIPLLLANTGQPRGEDGQINVLPRFASVSSPALVTWSGYGDRYPLAVQTPVGSMETPALQLYRHYCREHACKTLPASAEESVQAPPIAVQWGLDLAPQQAQIADISHCTAPGVLDQLGQAIFWKLGNSAQVNCPYTLTLSASDLEASSVEDRALLRQLLTDKLILVGAHITSASDLVQSPLHGKIPGIYLHAMALDNLITQGMDYDRDPSNLIWGIDWLDLVEVALLLLIAVLKALHDRRQQRLQLITPWPRWEKGFFASPYPSWCVVLSLLFLLSLMLYACDITPANVLAILLLSLALFSDKIEAFIGRED
ncbi:CHASE2 domain-containing sensor protein [Metapseudomonas resinovorans]|uniref:CHASE2 domain-containing protein n=1 Tax=Metapseudomonas resinovorans TaxID=53412 RepID=UPI003D1EDB62